MVQYCLVEEGFRISHIFKAHEVFISSLSYSLTKYYKRYLLFLIFFFDIFIHFIFLSWICTHYLMVVLNISSVPLSDNFKHLSSIFDFFFFHVSPQEIFLDSENYSNVLPEDLYTLYQGRRFTFILAKMFQLWICIRWFSFSCDFANLYSPWHFCKMQ